MSSDNTVTDRLLDDARKGPAAAKQGKIAIGLGVAAVLIGVFFFALNISMR